jgi:hypothetical protein
MQVRVTCYGKSVTKIAAGGIGLKQGSPQRLLLQKKRTTLKKTTQTNVAIPRTCRPSTCSARIQLAALLWNCYNSFSGSQTSQFFGLQSMPLDQLLPHRHGTMPDFVQEC